MLERSKWQKELVVFSRLMSTIVLTGNINDQHPIINEKEQRINGFCSLEMYVAQTCKSMGYQAVLCYSPVDGFYLLPGIRQDGDVLTLVEQIVAESRTGAGGAGAGTGAGSGEGEDDHGLKVQRDKCSFGPCLMPDNMPDAAHIIGLILSQSNAAIAVIMEYTSRMVARPDDLDLDERMTFMYLQNGAARARRNNVAGKNGGSALLQNVLFLIADKINDLPAWYYLGAPGLKNINIPRPDYQMRSSIITGNASLCPGYDQASEEEKKQFADIFVGASEGFTTQDLVRVFQIAQYRHIDVHNIDKAIMLYKHGVQENPWLKLDAEKLRDAENLIRRRVLGQDLVVKAAVDIIKRAALGMSGLQHVGNSSKPRGILFLAGPTGTGKTELAKALTELIFMDERNMIRFDMSEYRQAQADQRLLGAPPGYVGYEAGGQLTNAVREHPFSVLLFDEIEKAHPSILDKFLQVLEDGRITDGRGDTVYFQDCLIIFTSNLGMTIPSPDDPKIRITNVDYNEDKDYKSVHDKILNGVKHYFNEEIGRPELLNRIGNNILVFDFIREDSVRKILQKQLGNITRNLAADKHINLVLEPQAEEDLYQFAVDALSLGQGGRGIGNVIEEKFINPLSRYMFDHDLFRNADIVVKHVYMDGESVEMEAENTGGSL